MEKTRKKRVVSKKHKRAKLTEVNGITGKECSKCDTWKPLEEFYILKSGVGGRTPMCDICQREKDKKIREKKQTEKARKQRAKERYHEVKNTPEFKAQKRKYSAKRKDKDKEYMRKWRVENKDKNLVNFQNYKARKKALPNTWTEEQQQQVLEHFGGCALTGSTDIDFDHVIPLVIGHGGTTLENMIPLRADLNRSKNQFNLFEWFEENRERFSLSQDKFNSLIDYLSELNEMTPVEYKDYVYWCYENRVDLIG